jgi:hypothetical protein
MSKKEKDGTNTNLKVLEFKKPPDVEDEETPDYIIESLELLLKQAKEKKLRALILHYDYNDYDEKHQHEHTKSNRVFWTSTYNPLEIVALTRMLERKVVDFAEMILYDDDEHFEE